MSSHPRNLKAFLTHARNALTAPIGRRPSPLTFVVGNESADLDSICSAFLFAYLRSHTAPKYTLHVPLANIPRHDLSLRPELSATLDRAGLRSEDLLTLTDLDELADPIDPADTRWLLVDHNALTGTLAERFAGRVVGCIDHHVEEKVMGDSAEGEPRIIVKAASCASLVVKHCQGAWEALRQQEKEQGEASAAESLAYVALGPILIDSNNLKTKTKATEADNQAVRFVESLLELGPNAFSRNNFFEELRMLKTDIHDFSFEDIFRKDYKSWTEEGMVLGTSSVPQDFNYMFKHIGSPSDFLCEFKKFAEARNIDIACVMTSPSTEKRKFGHYDPRNLFVWALNKKLAVDAVELFKKRESANLGLTPFKNGTLDDQRDDVEVRYCWIQGQAKNTRKQLAPKLRDAMREAVLIANSPQRRGSNKSDKRGKYAKK